MAGEEETKRRAEALGRVRGALEALREDELFQMDLGDEEVRAAIEHWSGRKRLSYQEAEERFEENYKVLQVLGKLKALQAECKRAGIGVPLKALLEGKTDPFHGIELRKEEDRRKEEAAASLPLSREELPGKSSDLLTLSLRNVAVWWSFQILFIAMIFQSTR